MLDALFSQPNYVAAKKMLDVAVLRHEAIASNLANLETPNYKRVDVAPSFSSELQRAFASGNSEEISATHPSLSIDPAASPRLDGNTVDLESELAEMNKNYLAHALETQLVTGSLLKLRLAITGRAS